MKIKAQLFFLSIVIGFLLSGCGNQPQGPTVKVRFHIPETIKFKKPDQPVLRVEINMAADDIYVPISLFRYDERIKVWIYETGSNNQHGVIVGAIGQEVIFQSQPHVKVQRYLIYFTLLQKDYEKLFDVDGFGLKFIAQSQGVRGPNAVANPTYMLRAALMDFVSGSYICLAKSEDIPVSGLDNTVHKVNNWKVCKTQ